MVAYAKKEAQKPPCVTPQEYLERECQAQTKSEYHGGVIVAMAGASPEHNIIVFDVIVTLGAQLRGGPCQGFPSDLRVRVPACEAYYYPDMIVVCGEPEYEEIAGMRSLRNPTVLIEVLSDSTEATDRGEKWRCYQTLDSLQTYVLIAQDRPLVEVYERQPNGWFYMAVTGLESTVPLNTVGCELRLTDVYARIVFPPPAREQDNAETTAG